MRKLHPKHFATDREGDVKRTWLASVAMMAAVILGCAAQAGARDDAKVIMPDDPKALKARATWGYNDAIVVGDTVYLSGVVASTKDGDANLEAAYTRAFDKLGAILAKAGASWDDVVEITSFHTDVVTQMPAITVVKNRYVRAPFPAWTAIQVVRLVPDRGITEIKLVAKLGGRLQPAHQ
jgi:enamine deaminase RidA (YjgF/YER057c/UK114 family)